MSTAGAPTPWLAERFGAVTFVPPLRVGRSGNDRLPVAVFDGTGRLLAAHPDRQEADRYVHETKHAAGLGPMARPRPFRTPKIDPSRRFVASPAGRAERAAGQ